jgi:hypothetical protein
LTRKETIAFTQSRMNTDVIRRSVFVASNASSKVLPRPGKLKATSAIVTDPIIAGTLPAR